MAKDFSDFILYIHDAGERVYHLIHLRNTPELQRKNEVRALIEDFHHYKYRVNMDRAYRIKWAPWKKVIRRPPFKVRVEAQWYFGGEKKGTVVKKTVYIVRTRKPLFQVKVFETIKEFLRSKKVGIIFYQEPCTHRCNGCKLKCEDMPVIVEPMHISRIHQPSGEMKG